MRPVECEGDRLEAHHHVAGVAQAARPASPNHTSWSMLTCRNPPRRALCYWNPIAATTRTKSPLCCREQRVYSPSVRVRDRPAVPSATSARQPCTTSQSLTFHSMHAYHHPASVRQHSTPPTPSRRDHFDAACVSPQRGRPGRSP